MMSSTSLLLAFVLSVTSSIRFDTHPATPAVEVTRNDVPRQIPDSRLVQIRLDVSTIVASEFQGVVEEAMIQVTTRQPSTQVVDYWPRTEMYSTIMTPLSISEEYERYRQAAFQGAGGYPGVGSASGHAYFHDDLQRDLHYQQKPPMQLLSAAGTIDRGAGVFFKLRATPQLSLEGSRSFSITMEVPINWRGDVLEFQAMAFGKKHSDSNQSRKPLAEERYWVAVYLESDGEAARQAVSFVHQQAKLRKAAEQFAAAVHKRAYPTPVHKLGQALDIYQPPIPPNYLDQWMFGSVSEQPHSSLPVDLRVAMLDFIDSRAVMEQLSGMAWQPPSPYLAKGSALSRANPR